MNMTDSTSPSQENTNPNNNSLAMASMILGILALLGSFMCLAIPLGALSILFALLSRTKINWDKKAIIGMILSGIAILLSIISTIFFFRFIVTPWTGSKYDDYDYDYYYEYDYPSPYDNPYEDLPYDYDEYYDDYDSHDDYNNYADSNDYNALPYTSYPPKPVHSVKTTL